MEQLKKIRTDVFGWFEEAGDIEPAYDPGITAICPICGTQLSSPMKTISLMKDKDARSYFYRTHKTCYESVTEEDITAIESSLIDT